MKEQPKDEALEELLEYLRRARGVDLTGYKRTSLSRRTMRRVQATGTGDFAGYLDYLQVHPEEFPLLFNTILINVTSFFRDPAAWDYLSAQIIPRLLKDRWDAPVRCWSAGCASGEEAYTLAIVLAEAMGANAARQQVKIYATDVDEEALAQARQASYNAHAMQGVPPELREKYFEETNGRYYFRPDLRRIVIFGRHDLVQDAPISRLDLLLCRNTLMYFNAETQSQILSRFYFGLNDNGYLFLGRAEMLLTHANLFTPVNLRYRIFSKVVRNNLYAPPPLALPATANHEENKEPHLQEAAFEHSSTAQVVVDIKGILTMANEQARSMFGLDRRDIGRPLQDLELSYRPVELRSLIDRVYADKRSTTATDVERVQRNGESQFLNVEISPLLDVDGRPLGVNIAFHNVTRNKQMQQELQRFNQELETAYEELQSSNEELETTNEELQSSNEELETTNEELQSSNEELETMNEELQSTNEELETINEELRRRTEELDRVNSFLASVFASLRSGVAVLDENSNIVIWNARAADMWGLRPEEVQGKSFFNLDIGLPVEQLRDMIQKCLKGEEGSGETVVDAINRRGRTFRCAVSCTPVRGLPEGAARVIVLMEERGGPTPPPAQEEQKQAQG